MSKEKLLSIDAGVLFTPESRFSPGRLILEGPTVGEAGSPDSIRIPKGAERLDASQLLVSPGFIDSHVHGGAGMDVMQADFESLNGVSRFLSRHGTTSFLPTTVSSPPDVLTATIERLGETLSRSFDGASPLGIHLEGPFINAAKRGTHKAANVLAPDAGLLESWIAGSRGRLRLITIAPELNGTHSLLSMAVLRNVSVAMGHSDATFDQAIAAVNRGVCYAVHTFNAMRAFTHRDPGIVGAVLADDRVFAEIIADGVHVDQAVVKVFAQAKGKSRILLVTDAISATGMPDGTYRLGEDTVEVVNGACRDQEGRLAGSTLTQDCALRNLVQWTGWKLEDALPALTCNPARALKLDRKGVLEPGADADLVMLDRNLQIVKTFVRGRLVFDR